MNTTDRTSGRRKPILIVVGLLVLGSVAFAGWRYVQPSHDPTMANSNLSCDTGMSHAKMMHDAPGSSAVGEPPVIDKTVPPGDAPEGMVWIPAGEFSMGSEEPSFPDARPVHRVTVHGYWMDKTEVTNEMFEKFVDATGYVTVAERKPRAEDYPGVPAEKLVAGSIVFSPPSQAVPRLKFSSMWPSQSSSRPLQTSTAFTVTAKLQALLVSARSL